MKVAFVIKINFDSIISTTNQINILKYFSKHYEITIFTNAISFFKKQGIKANYISITFFSFPYIDHFFICDSIINLKLKKIDYDILVIWYDSLLFFPLKKPVIRFIDVCPYQSFAHLMKKDKKRLDLNPLFLMIINSFKKSSFIITISPQMKQFLIDYGISNDKIAWLNQGVDLNRFTKKLEHKKNGEFILIYTGQFLPNRGSDIIIESMKKLSLNNANIKFISVGNTEFQLQKWNPILRKMKLENNVRLYGVVDNEKIPEFLSNANIGVSILEKNEYYNKCTPQKIFEYMAMHLPIIANDLPTHTDYIKNGYNGFIINTTDEFVETVLKLKNDEDLYKKMSDNSYESAKKYDLKKIELKLKELIDNFVKK